MPDLALPNRSNLEEGHPLFFFVHAPMIYPRDDQQQVRWVACGMVGTYVDLVKVGAPDSALEGFHVWLRVLWDLRQPPRRQFKDGLARIRRACLSGHVLLYLLRLLVYHPGRCRLEQAKALVLEFAPPEGATLSDSLLTKVWAEFQTVSHLWAAKVLMQQDDRDLGMDNREWIDLLALSESLRKRAEAGRLLHGRNTWKVPPDVVLPPVSGEEEITPLTPEHLSFLEAQFPG